MSSSDALHLEFDGRVAIATLNRSASRNALDDEMADALVAACERVNADLGVSCVVLASNGPAFCAGGNVKDMYARNGMFGGTAAEMRRAYRAGIQRIPLAFYALEVPVVAAVGGPAIGAGCDLAMMCDIRLASHEATFAESFIRLGLISGDGGAWWLQRIAGVSRAYQMTLTGDAISAEQAATWGIVSSVHPAQDLLKEAIALAQRIASHPPHSVRLNKRLLRESERSSLAQSLELAAALQSIAQHTEDLREGVSAMVEKRKPEFRGR
jgi:enoyl-CoA hydratase/carnithine racemase